METRNAAGEPVTIEQRAIQEAWLLLMKDIVEALDEDPAGARAQGLADRWRAFMSPQWPEGRTCGWRNPRQRSIFTSRNLESSGTPHR